MIVRNIEKLLAEKYKDIGKTIKALIIREMPFDMSGNTQYFSANEIFNIIDEVINDEVKKLT